ncbi:Putative glycoside hydrolase family 18, catalytic domain, glycosyl hydrolase family 18 (GH18) active [Septoria linicola]|uniref:chitinase n=1 Tax=Septoria linicola TaxID=215465 RepID=A0A9Q9ASU0_9PEZI|nr:putative glycoside hydrolase family 18, catalytic domain, glycosyl hydrolase family 18 (GH18) active [Septoria linicola]USW51910.1 Putative glycoside hydrolase family 18, catalytic domain, glycosyl hydrolase family 18 (GH18) active [Septoria linicola]
MLFSTVWLGLLGLAVALPADSTSSLEKRADPYNPPRNVIYVQTFRTVQGGKLSILPLIQQRTNITHIYLSAVHINAQPGDINLNDDNPNSTVYDAIWQESAQLQQSGVKVMMMLGGAAPGSYPRLCSGPNGGVNESYYVPLRNTLKYHKVDGLDLDIEERVPYTCPLALLRRLNADFGSNFILTMAPVASDLQPNPIGLGGFSYKTLDAQATSSAKPSGKLVNWYNAQFYNGWGDASTPNGYNAIVANGWPANRVVMGVLDSPNDGGSGWYNISTYQKTIKTLKSNYANFGSVCGWEYWDAGIRDNYANPWQWVGAVGQSVFASSTGTAPANRATNVDSGPAPFPNLMSALLGKGVGKLEAVRALNISDGSLAGALQVLGLPDLGLGGILPIKK